MSAEATFTESYLDSNVELDSEDLDEDLNVDTRHPAEIILAEKITAKPVIDMDPTIYAFIKCTCGNKLDEATTIYYQNKYDTTPIEFDIWFNRVPLNMRKGYYYRALTALDDESAQDKVNELQLISETDLNSLFDYEYKIFESVQGVETINPEVDLRAQFAIGIAHTTVSEVNSNSITRTCCRANIISSPIIPKPKVTLEDLLRKGRLNTYNYKETNVRVSSQNNTPKNTVNDAKMKPSNKIARRERFINRTRNSRDNRSLRGNIIRRENIN